MSEYEYVLTSRYEIRCDATGCGAKDYTAEVQGSARWLAAPEQQRRLTASGWRVFAGRTRRWYCPEHGPQPGHLMREVTRG